MGVHLCGKSLPSRSESPGQALNPKPFFHGVLSWRIILHQICNLFLLIDPHLTILAFTHYTPAQQRQQQFIRLYSTLYFQPHLFPNPNIPTYRERNKFESSPETTLHFQ